MYCRDSENSLSKCVNYSCPRHCVNNQGKGDARFKTVCNEYFAIPMWVVKQAG